MTSNTGEQDFLRRWSRLKTEARGDDARTSPAPDPALRSPAEQAPEGGQKHDVMPEQAPVVPPVESLNLDSDYRPFFHPKIEEGVRRAALKKLFSDPHFNVMDGLDTYIDDYSKPNPLPDGMLEQLEQAKKIIAWSREDAEERADVEERAKAEREKTELVNGAPAGAVTPSHDSLLINEADSPATTAPLIAASDRDSTRGAENAE